MFLFLIIDISVIHATHLTGQIKRTNKEQSSNQLTMSTAELVRIHVNSSRITILQLQYSTCS